MTTKYLFAALLAATLAAPALANPARDAQMAGLAVQAKKDDAAFAGFSAERGRALYQASFTTGKADTPSCTTCHNSDPKAKGQTKAGKEIEPMAVSRNPTRYTDPAELEKWFPRNCNQVLGRECTAREKGDFLTFMIAQ
ncbi:MAG: DUF1924 domain-containing protein [Rhodospirillales bacterium]|nr:DUF1924 domain-containing protein [Rhodospirillales bacterium]